MREAIIQQIARQYGLPDTVVLSTEKGYRNESHPLLLADGRRANIIVYKNEPGILQKIRTANQTANFLAARGFPARRTLDACIVRLQTGRQTKYAALYNYLPGNTIPWEAYTMDHLKLLGKTMSDMHNALRAAPAGAPSVAAEYLAITVRMQRYFAATGVQQALATKLSLTVPAAIFDDLRTTLIVCQTLSGQQALHMDFVRGNILFTPGEQPLRLTGILDFEKTAVGHPLFDIARTLAFLLVDCKYKPAEKIRKYFLYSGYNKRGAATSRDVRVAGTDSLLETLTTLFLLHDFYKFLRHNPYEFLLQNEHFVRTRDILLARGIISRPANL